MKIHIDIDCFFVSATRIIEPHLEGKTVAIGGRSDTKIFDTSFSKQKVDFQNSGNFVPIFYKDYEQEDDDIRNFIDSSGKIRGILTTASYEARAYGIKTAMRIDEALQLCPSLIIKAPNMTLYQKLSHQLHEFLMQNIPIVEQASIDEFYGDLTGWIEDKDVEEFIDILRHRIKKELHLPVSIGASNTKYIAKLATNFAKPFGSKVIFSNELEHAISYLQVKDFPGVGKKMMQKFHQSGIYTLGDVLKRKKRMQTLGPYALELYYRISALKDDELKISKPRKSIGISRTIDPLYDRMELRRRVHILVRHLSHAILRLDVYPTVYHFSLRYEMNKKSHVNISSTRLFSEQFFDTLCMRMLQKTDIYKRLHIIRISISCGSFTKDSKKELDLTTYAQAKQERKLNEVTLKAREKYGLHILKWGSEL